MLNIKKSIKISIFFLIISLIYPGISVAVNFNGSINNDTIWTDAGSPYIITDNVTVFEGVKLTIEPGVVIKFNEGQIKFIINGTLNAEGTQARPIYFTSFRDDSVGGDTNNDGESSGLPGDWFNIHFTSNSQNNVLDNVVVRYGGKDTPLRGGSLFIETSSLIITQSIIEESETNGIYISNASPEIKNNNIINNTDTGIYLGLSNAKITNNTISGNSSFAISIYDPSSNPLINNNTIVDNETNAVRLSGTIKNSIKWESLDAAYVITEDLSMPETEGLTISKGVNLTIGPGVVVKFDSSKRFKINGSLIADGSSTKPIYFTSLYDDNAGGDTNGDKSNTDPAPGDWFNLYFTSESSGNILDNIIIRYGGAEFPKCEPPYCNTNISIETNSLSLSGSIIEQSANHGIYISEASPLIYGCDISINAGYGINLNLSNAILIKNNIQNNNIAAYNSTSSVFTNAYYNYWGDSSGPYDNSNIDDLYNPDGNGDGISNYINYKPWLEDPLLSSLISINSVNSPTKYDTQKITGNRESGVIITQVSVNTSAIIGEIIYPTNTTWEFMIINLEQSPNTITVMAEDEDGIIASDTVSIIYDSSTYVNIETMNIITNIESQTITGTMEIDSIVELSSDKLAVLSEIIYPTESTWQCTINDLMEDLYTITATARDSASNTATYQINIIYDATPPEVTIEIINILTNMTNQTISGTRESGADISVTADTPITAGEVIYPTEDTWECLLNGFVEKTNSITITATDAAGNTAAVQTSIIYDAVEPDLSIDPVKTPTNINSQTITGTREFGVLIEINANEAVMIGDLVYPTEDTWKCTISNLAEKFNNIIITARDAAGNTASLNVSIIYDITPPLLSIDNVNNKININSQTIKGSMENGAIVEVIVDEPAISENISYPTSTTWECNITNLAEKTHNIIVTARDAAKNSATVQTTITYDATLPNITINPVTSPTNINFQIITGDREAGAITQVDVDEPAASGELIYPTELTWKCTISNLGEKTHSITVTVRDAVENTASVRTYITYDNTVPQLSIDPVITPTNIVSQIIGGTRESSALIRVEVDSPASSSELIYPTNTTWKCTVSGMAEKSHNITVKATDAANNTASKQTSISYDSTPPDLTITPVKTPTNISNQIIKGTMEAGVLIQIEVDSPALKGEVTYPTSTTWECSIFGLTQKSHNITVKATDAAKNTISKYTAITYDSTPPNLTINAVNSPTNLASQQISGTMEANALIQVEVNEPASKGAVTYPTNTTWKCTISNMTEKTHNITVKATDSANNTASKQTAIIYDSTSPDLTINPVNSPTNISNQQISGTMEADALIEIEVDEPASKGGVSYPTNATWKCTISGMTNKTHNITVKATDAAKNTTSKQTAIIYDSTSPDLTINPVNSPTNISNQQISGTMEAGVLIEVEVDEPALKGEVSYPTNITWKCAISNLTEKSHDITVKAADAANNITSRKISIIYDITPPELSIDEIKTKTNINTQTIRGTRELGADIKVEVDEPARIGNIIYPTDITWECTISNLAEKTHQLTAIATDEASNFAFVQTSITYDTSLPVLTINPVKTPTNIESQKIHGTMEEGAVIEIETDEPAVSGNIVYPTDTTWECIITGLTEKIHNIIVKATDNAENTAYANTAITYDISPPMLSIDPVKTPTNIESQKITGNREAGAEIEVKSDEPAITKSLIYPTDTKWECIVTGMIEKQHTITVTAKDAAENTTINQVSILYDNTPPLISINQIESITKEAYQIIAGETEINALVEVFANTSDAEFQVIYPTENTWTSTINLEEGLNTITVTAIDAAENTSTVQANITYDNIPPTVSINPVIPVTDINSQTITGHKEIKAEISVSVDTSAIVGQIIYPTEDRWECIITDLQEHANKITVTATDEAKNTALATVIITLDLNYPGDLNDDGKIDLTDLILSLQVITNIEPFLAIHKEADVNNDNKIGMEEAVYDLLIISE
ncbi:putative pectate lyase C (modular protein) [Candidatus Magnetomoraceae bacterium gMMP-1]